MSPARAADVKAAKVPSSYAQRKLRARLEGEVRLWTALGPAEYADKIAELKAKLSELAP